MHRTAPIWLAACAVLILAMGPAAATAQAHAHALDRTYHFGFKKSKNGEPASIEQEGFKPILQKHGAVFIGDARAKALYLTFDNGYENGYTVQVLDVLKAKQVKAAFFVTGHFVKDQPALVKRMVEEGHLVGNHSWSHPDMTQISDSKIREELDKVKRQVAEVTGQKEMRFMRPPRGIFNDRMLGVSKSSGYTNVFWSIAYKDWDVNAQKGGDYAYRKVIEQLHPGAVILLHSVSRDNAEALGRIIDEARRQGYEFQTLDQLTAPTVPILPTVSSASAPPAPKGTDLTVLHEGRAVRSIQRADYVLPAFPLLQPDKLELLLQQLEQQINKAPRNAVIGKQGEIVAEQNGLKLDRQKMADQLAFYLYGFDRSYIEAPTVTQYAKVDSEMLGQLRGKRLGHYFTYYNAGNRARAHNIALAAEAINSTVIFPGERFSFNGVVGMRTIGKGYKRAPVIVKGELSEGIGGGICQVSSTLYNAVDRAGLTIVERYSHSRSVPYVLPGRDATVSWGGPDFVFQNRYNQPVLIRAHAAGGRVFVALYSSDVIEYKPRNVPEMFKRLPQEVPAQHDSSLTEPLRRTAPRTS